MGINEQLFREYYDNYFDDICRFLNYYTHDPYAIEEVVQELFVKLWEDRNKRDIEFIKTYLYSSARNRMLNYLRDRNTNTAVMSKWAQTELENMQEKDCIDRNEFALCLQSAIENLPEKCREIFILSRKEKLSYKEIAGIQQISVKTVENQMGTALKRIREYILSHYEKTAPLLFYLLNIRI